MIVTPIIQGQKYRVQIGPVSITVDATNGIDARFKAMDALIAQEARRHVTH